MVIDNKFRIGEIVYLKTDNDQLPRIVTRILVSVGEIMYEVSGGTSHTDCWEFELSTEKDLIATL